MYILDVVGLSCCQQGLLSVATRELLTAVASLVVKQSALGAYAQ